MNSSDPCASQHGHDQLKDHRHVDGNTIALEISHTSYLYVVIITDRCKGRSIFESQRKINILS